VNRNESPRIEPAGRRVDAAARRLLGPLLGAGPSASGWRLVSWDAEQGLSLVFGQGQRFVLVELEARNDKLDCYDRTALFNICARSQFTPDGSLTREERGLVEGVVRFVGSRESLLTVDERPTPQKSEVREILVDRVLIPEGATRYYVNPYAGCMIGCSFCYVAARADFSRRLEGAPPPEWGRWVDVKTNAAEVLAREVEQHPPGLVRMSPILTDPYQAIERRYRVTRACLEVLLHAGYSPAILTRESRVLDDLDLLSGHGRAAVGFSIPTDDDQLRKQFEPGADRIENRFQALRTLSEAGVPTCVVVQPVLPMNVEAFVERIAPWAKAVRIDRMYFGDRVRARYEAAGIGHAATVEYQTELVEELGERFERAGLIVDRSDNLAGIIEELLAG
jgi:DNA repair photolyase